MENRTGGPSTLRPTLPWSFSPIKPATPPPAMAFWQMVLTQPKNGNLRSFRPCCGRHNRMLPSLDEEIRVASAANARPVKPPLCSAIVCRHLSLDIASSHAFHTYKIEHVTREVLDSDLGRI